MDYKICVRYLLSILCGIMIGMFLSNNCLNNHNVVLLK